MKAEVLMRSRCDHQSSVSSKDVDTVTMDTQEEQYSPWDFINQSKLTAGEITSCSASQTTSSSLSPVTIATQSVIRPIPMLPLDTSIYSSPPTYVDNLPASLGVPVIPNTLQGKQLNKRDLLDVSIARSLQSSTSSYPRSPTSSEGSSSQGQDVYECRWFNCERQFTCKDDLVIHVNEHHVRVERADSEYQCKWGGCPRQGKGFNARYKMLIHIRTHTNEKPHKCALCGKSFSRLENLKIHMRSHTGEKPYTCPFEGCSKAYSNSSDRFKHIRNHQEDKPYVCKKPGCNKRYTDPSSLRKHVRLHGHNVKVCAQTQPVLTAKISPSSISNIIDITRPSISAINSSMATNVIVPISLLSATTDINSSGVIRHSGIHSNPLLSSAIFHVPKQMISTQTEGLVSLTVQRQPVLNNSIEKGQDCPLDLSTSASDTIYVTDDKDDVVTPPTVSSSKFEQDMVRWEVINMVS